MPHVRTSARLAAWLVLAQQTRTTGGQMQPEGCAVDPAIGNCICADAVGNSWDLGPDVGRIGPMMGPCTGTFCRGQWRCALPSGLLCDGCRERPREGGKEGGREAGGWAGRAGQGRAGRWSDILLRVSRACRLHWHLRKHPCVSGRRLQCDRSHLCLSHRHPRCLPSLDHL